MEVTKVLPLLVLVSATVFAEGKKEEENEKACKDPFKATGRTDNCSLLVDFDKITLDYRFNFDVGRLSEIGKDYKVYKVMTRECFECKGMFWGFTAGLEESKDLPQVKFQLWEDGNVRISIVYWVPNRFLALKHIWSRFLNGTELFCDGDAAATARTVQLFKPDEKDKPGAVEMANLRIRGMNVTVKGAPLNCRDGIIPEAAAAPPLFASGQGLLLLLGVGLAAVA